MYDLNCKFMMSLTPEQKAICHTGAAGQILVLQASAPLIITSILWMVAFFVRRKRMDE
jgi:hypothetical protein